MSSPVRIEVSSALSSAAIGSGYAGVLPSVVAAFALGLYEHHQLRDRLPADCLGMRRNLTLAVCGTLALTMFASESVGLQ